MKIVRLFTLICLIVFSSSLFGQVAINTTGAAPNGSAMLDVQSTDAGMLIPRMTSAQKSAISSPATGLMIYQTDGADGFYYYNGTGWTIVSTGSAVTDVTGTAPVVSSGGTTPAISMPAATTSQDGYLTQTDWDTFNDKVSSQWTTSGSNIYYSSGFIGLGTTSPQTRLQLGTNSGSNFITLAGGATNQSYGIDWSFTTPGSAYYGRILLDYNTRTTKGLQINSAYDISFNDILSTGTIQKEILRIKNSTGYVGINTNSPNSILHVYGSISYSIVNKGVNYTASGYDNIINVTTSGITITLPSAIGIDGRTYTVKLSVSGTATVSTSSSQTIDGATSYSLSAQYKYVTVISDGANWLIIGNN